MLSELQERQLVRTEQEYLTEPERDVMPDEVDAYKHTCSLCDCYPDDDFLYFHDGEWVCADCLLDNIPKRDIYSGETFGL